MRYSTLVAGLLSLAGAVNCLKTSHVDVLESLNGIPEGWKDVGLPNPKQRLHFRIAVKQQNQELFEQTLMDVSTPGHPRYGQHLKRDEVKALIRPRAESTDAVLQWLEDSGVKSRDVQNDGEWINFVASVSTAEEMMDTTFKFYQSTVREDVTKIRTLQYSVPKELFEHIDMVQPTTRFGQMRPQRSQVLGKEVEVIGEVGSAAADAAAANATCGSSVTPDCLKNLYNFASYTPSKVKTLFGVNGFLEEYARFTDLAAFLKQYVPSAVGTNFTYALVDGGKSDQNSQNDSVEANLDIDYTVGLVGSSVPVTFFSTGGRGELIPDLDQPDASQNQNEPYLEFFTYLTGLPDDQLPQTLSTSYGEDEQSVPEAYSKSVCNMIAQLGTRGVSVLFSSGDTGVGSACQTNDGKNTTRFLPTFPASCPYVTSVGGTHYVNPESAIYFSSGGFSDRFPRPSYQDSAVTTYLSKLGSKWDGLYNKTGRGIPDVAAQGSGFRVVDKGQVISVGGTSASAPTFSSVVALLNNARVGAGLKPLGFLNPWIYSSGYTALNDITTGGSTGCTGTDQYSGLPAPYVPYASWNATAGWDPVTGHGTPDFGKLLKQVLANSTYATQTYGRRHAREMYL